MEFDTKVYILLLKHIFIKYEREELVKAYGYHTTDEDDKLLISGLYNMIKIEPSFFYLSERITNNIEFIYNMLMQKYSEYISKEERCEVDGFFDFIRKETLKVKKDKKIKYLQENYKTRSGLDEFCYKIKYCDKDVVDQITYINTTSQAYDYTFYLNIKENNFDEILVQKNYLEYIFSLSYFTSYMPEFLIFSRKEIFIYILDEILKKRKDVEEYVDCAKKRLEKIY